ncbi:branched-chain amino acid ABC transporter substrate-binding protein [Kouleothrix sp.]|uniref:branched-chain amino acid ABC transporter substrate-binding protein n=1 Tax=Kouleothrix sp. TaxID=2779161 RepID=UPI003918CD7F
MISPANTYPGLTKPGKGEAGEPEKYYPNGKRNYTPVRGARRRPAGAAAANWAKELGVKRLLHPARHQRDVRQGHCRRVPRQGQGEWLRGEGLRGHRQESPGLQGPRHKIKSANPDLVYFGGITQNNAGLLLKDLRAAGYTGKFMGPDGIYEDAFLEAAGEAGEGAYATFGGVPASKLTGKGKEWYDAYKKEFNSEPEVYAVYGYEATNVALNAINKVCKKDRAAILDAVFSTKDFDGVTGKFSIDANGDTSPTTMSGVQVKGGKFDADTTTVLEVSSGRRGSRRHPARARATSGERGAGVMPRASHAYHGVTVSS